MGRLEQPSELATRRRHRTRESACQAAATRGAETAGRNTTVKGGTRDYGEEGCQRREEEEGGQEAV